MKFPSLLLITFYFASCSAQEKTVPTPEKTDQKQISEYVVSVTEDSSGDLWFGTLDDGIARFDGKKLKYFTTKDGLPSNRVTNISQDSTGVYWLNTGEGLAKFDGKEFTNYPIKKDDANANSVSQFFIDSKSQIWVGTWGGVYIFDGSNYTKFDIPVPKIKTPINEDTKNWITEITEDPEGNIWFAKDGYGATKYDGENFTFVLKRDGLYSNNVTDIEFDQKGNIWFGSRVAERDNPNPDKREGPGGITKFDGENYTHFPDVAGINEADVYQVYIDNSDYVWISTTSNGVYKYDGKSFENYPTPIAIMDIQKDSNGNIWFAGAGGLYKLTQQEELLNITTDGPW